MNFTYNIVTGDKGRYLKIVAAKAPLESEQQTLDLMSLCVENETHLLMIHASAISDSFFRLATGVAGDILQKMINYHIITAFVLTEKGYPKRFIEMIMEANKGGQYRFFYTAHEAEQWLLSCQEN